MVKRVKYIFLVFFCALVATVAAAQNEFCKRLVNKGYDIVNIENSGVRQFIANRSYDDPELTGNYSYSVVRTYSKGVSSKPAGLILEWDSITPVENISKLVVTLVETDQEADESILDQDLTDEIVRYYYPPVGRYEYLLCNMRPDRYFYYKLEEELRDGQRLVRKRGKFYTQGQVRMLRVDGMANVRDFGGWRTSFGKEVVYGRIFRGNRPEGITYTGKNDFVKNENITADLDLRGSYLSQSPLGPLNQVEYYCTNNQRYKLALTSGRSALAKDLDIIAEVLMRGGNVFLHCNHGMNRAGTLSFIVEGLLGFSEADLSRDYELSSFAYGNSRNSTYGAMLPEIRSYGRPGDDLAQCFYNFACSLGVHEETLDVIRSIMLDVLPDDPIIVKAHRR